MYWFVQALKNSLDFSGRARRREYWWFQLLGGALPGMLLAVAMLLTAVGHFASGTLLMVLTGIAMLAMLPAAWSVTFRRLHDTGRSAWWLLIGFVPVVGGLIFLVLMLLEGEPGANQYGPNPKA